MRIREILFHNFRSYRGERRISFVDPLTDTVRPLSVLAGSNGSGKTTILETIEALLRFALNQNKPDDLIIEAKESGLICLTIELSQEDYPQRFSLNRPREIIHIAAGQWDLAPAFLKENNQVLFSYAGRQDTDSTGVSNSVLAKMKVLEMQRVKRGGLIFFPYDRRLEVSKGGAIEPPTAKTPWVFRFSNKARWTGSLEQLWVWQNYLDLEQSSKSHTNLKPFVKTVEDVLGEGRAITIEEGRVTVPVLWDSKNDQPVRVHLDQLPSGEQQCLILFGELARRRRQGVIIAIDEIENSLHPTLQRLMIWNLRRLARELDAQVIVTTHSLEVINTVRGGAFINLDYPEDRFNVPLLDDREAA